jgi:acetyl esterase
MVHAMSTSASPQPFTKQPFTKRLSRKASRLLIEGFFHGASRAMGWLPLANPRRHGVEVLRDIPYRDGGQREHLLDIYRPIKREGPLPVVFYIHGGGFSLLSKETHWIFALMFARRGYLVVNINYRLAPQYPFPAGATDVCDAYVWLHQHIAEYGGDPSRVAVAGESAGANFAVALAVAACAPRPEPWAQAVYALNRPPRVVMPACGLLQVSDSERFVRAKLVGAFVAGRLQDLSASYLGGVTEAIELADPLLLLESTGAFHRPLPPFFIVAGSGDPVAQDSHRLEAALRQRGVPCVARYYPNEPHAFHAFVMRAQARACWRDTYSFLDQHLPASMPAR